MTHATRLRSLLAEPAMLQAPGVYDGITARLVELAGFAAAYMTGAGTSLARGLPGFRPLDPDGDGRQCTTITHTVDLPVIADADTGYGNESNVTRTVHEYERAGVAGIHLEDQVSPKRCSHLLNVVQGGKTPELSMDDARATGYRLVILPILPSLLLSTMTETAETVLAAVKATNRPPSASGKLDVAGRFGRFRSDEWNALRHRFREHTPAKAAE